jgi:hypothetical protein
VAKVVNKGLERKVAERISNNSECRDLPIEVWPDGVFPSGTFFLNSEQWLNMGLMVMDDGVEFAITDLSGANDLKNGYSVLFSDGSETPKMMCQRFKSEIRCSDTTSFSEIAKSAYVLFQQKPITKIRLDRTAYDIDPSIARTIMRTLSCIAP